MSLMTVLHAYQLMESQGWLLSHARSGYRVAPLGKSESREPIQAAVSPSEHVDINEFIFEVLQASKTPNMINFGFSHPSPDLYPRHHVTKALAAAARNMPISNTFDNLPPGNERLRSIIAKRYAAKGVNISPDEIVITAGALEALNLSLQACTTAGDWVVVESPTFYGALQSLERLGLKVLSIRTDPYEGIDIDSLERALQTHEVKACWLMSNYQNPLGYSLSEDKKQRVVKLLHRYDVALIEDDVYSELYAGNDTLTSMRYYDTSGNTMLCSSFSKSLVAGLRIGWVAAGKRALEVQKLQLMSTLSTSAPIQETLVQYLTSRNYELHLKHLRKKLIERKRKTVNFLTTRFGDEVNVVAHDGGYFIWIELPKFIDTTQLYYQLLEQNITVAPGKMFSLNDDNTHCLRLNASFELDINYMKALEMLVENINLQIKAASTGAKR